MTNPIKPNENAPVEAHQIDGENAPVSPILKISNEAASQALSPAESAERFSRYLEETIQRHPKQESDIKKSLKTPQTGDFHNEGPTMESHIRLFADTIHDIKNNKFADGVDEKTGAMIKEVVVQKFTGEKSDSSVNPDAVDYAFLHDIKKPDSMSLVVPGIDDYVEITWEQWEEIEARGVPYCYVNPAVQGGKPLPIESISYFHKSKGAEGFHGVMAAHELSSDDSISPKIIKTIGKHDFVYKWDQISAENFKDKYGDMDMDGIKFAIAMAYQDAMASIQKDRGAPDLGRFFNFVISSENYELINSVKAKVTEENRALTPKMEQKLQQTAKLNRKLSWDEVYAIVKLQKYSASKLSGAFKAALDNPDTAAKFAKAGMGQEQIDDIIAILTISPDQLGIKYGSAKKGEPNKMALIGPIIKNCLE